MTTQAFRSLAAYELAASLCDDLTAEIETWPQFEKWSIGAERGRTLIVSLWIRYGHVFQLLTPPSVLMFQVNEVRQ